jgi:TolB-like protein
MSSIIPGFEYDIFISYRQKDNKGDRWVSEFVDALKDELESTFKEEISVYFDINPHDGLLETHDVGASLKEKLKCLIFIPVISRTYCDPKSFAWEHELIAFVEQASHDQFGMKVKLPGGNVSNRILPVRIHDLDNEDIKLCESVLGGVLRGVEFIYKESGFNRPLKPDDDEKINLNKTKYRNQITKVALAIKEIIEGLKAVTFVPANENVQRSAIFSEEIKEQKKIELRNPAKPNNRKYLSGVALFAILIIGILLVCPGIFKNDQFKKLRTSDGRISVAVIPFRNMTNDTIWNVWQDGIQNLLITSLSNSEELKVRQPESITGLLHSKGLTNYASITPSIASNISQKLDANVMIYGSVNQSGDIIRLNAQLIDSKTEEVIKSFQVDGTAEKILSAIDSLSARVKNFLIISKLRKELYAGYQNSVTTNSLEAFRYFIYGYNAFYKEEDYSSAERFFLKSLSIDSGFTAAMLLLSYTYTNQESYKEAKKLSLRLYDKREQMPMQMKIRVNHVYAYLFETPYEELELQKQMLDMDDQWPATYLNLSYAYYKLFQYDKIIPELEKALFIFDKRDSKPESADYYNLLGFAYYKTRQYKKEEKLNKRAEKDFPENYQLLFWQSVLSLTEGDSVEENHYIEKYTSILKNHSVSEAFILVGKASIYNEANMFFKAEKYYREALESDPENPFIINNLAWFLIDKDRNVNEGLKLSEKTLKLNPEDYNYLLTKGLALYKIGKFQEALEIQQKSWDLRRKSGIYDHTAFLHLEEARKAVAGQRKKL